ncbi:MAG: hypothetical protein Q8P67_09415, partial [archaeon]|nr:hypothetical protein [archaeon]
MSEAELFEDEGSSPEYSSLLAEALEMQEDASSSSPRQRLRRGMLMGLVVLAVVAVALFIAGLVATVVTVQSMADPQQMRSVVVRTIDAALLPDDTASASVGFRMPPVSRLHGLWVGPASCALSLSPDLSSSPFKLSAAPLFDVYIGQVSLEPLGQLGEGLLGGAALGSGDLALEGQGYVTQVQQRVLEEARPSIFGDEDRLQASCSVTVDVSLWGLVPIRGLVLRWSGPVGLLLRQHLLPTLAGTTVSVGTLRGELAALSLPISVHVPLPPSVVSFAVSLPPLLFQASPHICGAPVRPSTPLLLIDS